MSSENSSSSSSSSSSNELVKYCGSNPNDNDMVMILLPDSSTFECYSKKELLVILNKVNTTKKSKDKDVIKRRDIQLYTWGEEDKCCNMKDPVYVLPTSEYVVNYTLQILLFTRAVRLKYVGESLIGNERLKREKGYTVKIYSVEVLDLSRILPLIDNIDDNNRFKTINEIQSGSYTIPLYKYLQDGLGSVLNIDSKYRYEGVDEDLFTLKDITPILHFNFSLFKLPVFTSITKVDTLKYFNDFKSTYYFRYPFLKAFDENWDNMMTAGGSVSKILIGRIGYETDIDIFFYNLSPDQATRKLYMLIDKILNYYQDNEEEDEYRKIRAFTYVIKSKNAITVSIGKHSIQFITRVYNTKK